MKEKKIAFVGFWDNFDVEHNLIYEILCKHYRVEITDKNNADYSICSLYKKDFIDATGVKIFYTAEAIAPDFTLFDYFIGFDELYFGDRYIRVPNYICNLKYKDDIHFMMNRHINNTMERKKFCSWVCSNGKGDKIRDIIFDELSKYKKIDSAGLYRNNIGNKSRVPDKRLFQKDYKFSLAIENTSYNGYTTEKLVEAFAAGGVPIYWGDPEVCKYFNTKAFINLMDYPSINEGIEAIKKIDQDNNLYHNMLSQQALVDNNSIDNNINDLENFLIHIFEQPIEKAYRRPLGQTARNIENEVKKGLYEATNNSSLGIVSKLYNVTRQWKK